MSRHPPLYPWTAGVSSHFPRLSNPLAAGLALWSVGMIRARSCSLTAVAGLLAPLLAQPFNPGRERWRATYREAPAPAGAPRVHLELGDCGAPGLAGVLEGGDGRPVALALDATPVGPRLVVRAIRVVARGGAVPVAGKSLSATEQPPGPPDGLALLKPGRDLGPSDWTVSGWAARGRYAKGWFPAMVAVGWHPLRRLTQPGQLRPQGGYHWVPFTPRVPAVGRRGQGQGPAFTGQDPPVDGPLWGCWAAGHPAAWLVRTDLPPHAAQVCWYGRRAWLEHGFKRFTSGGWQWPYTRRDAPSRAERRGLALAIATWWLLSVGGEAEAARPAAPGPPLPGAARRQGHGWRVVGMFRRGWNLLLAALLNHHPLPPGRGYPEPWPALLAVSDGRPTDPEGG